METQTKTHEIDAESGNEEFCIEQPENENLGLCGAELSGNFCPNQEIPKSNFCPDCWEIAELLGLEKFNIQ